MCCMHVCTHTHTHVCACTCDCVRSFVCVGVKYMLTRIGVLIFCLICLIISHATGACSGEACAAEPQVARGHRISSGNDCICIYVYIYRYIYMLLHM